MYWINDPTMWAGLFTLIILEIILGIDNLLFITIFVEKLPMPLNNKARITGLFCALVMRIVLLFSFTFIISFTTPIISFAKYNFSARDLLIFFGGCFLLFKASSELNERLRDKEDKINRKSKTAKFWSVVIQIIILDAIFSLDSVITAIGIIDNIHLMIIAIVISIALMIIASKGLIIFVNNHPNIIIICLVFLFMIGIVMITDSLGYEISKSYLYISLGVAIFIEICNELYSLNQSNLFKKKFFYNNNAKYILQILNYERTISNHIYSNSNFNCSTIDIMNLQDYQIVLLLLQFTQRTVNSIMIPINYADSIAMYSSKQQLLSLLKSTNHTNLVIVGDSLSNIPIGIVNIREIIKQYLNKKKIDLYKIIKQPLIFFEKLSLFDALQQFANTNISFAFVIDQLGVIKGILTLSDIINTITTNVVISSKKFDLRYHVKHYNNSMLVNSMMRIEDLKLYIPITIDKIRSYETIGGLLMSRLQKIPVVGDYIIIDNWIFEVFEATTIKLKKILITYKFSDIKNNYY
uniref:TerC family protein n=1 Tax=Candidatus Aschnera chinzeii TaxID=1485666 RepID=A0AAT9G3Q2_9ENTR|nr:MAG: TerC family protein [Candidatus Aschnera chinzeii]